MFRYRPLALWITAFAAGILCGVFAGNTVAVTLFAVIGVLCVICFAVRRFPYRTVIFPLLLAFLLGGVRIAAAKADNNEVLSRCDGKTATVIGNVDRVDTHGFVFTVAGGQDEFIPVGEKVRVYYDYYIGFNAGDSIVGTFTFTPSDFTSRSDGIYLFGVADEIKGYTRGGAGNPVADFRKNIGVTLGVDYGDSYAGLMKALLCGDSSDMDTTLYSAYRSAGISHILVISGFHVSLIVMTAYVLLCRSVFGRRYSGVICIILALAFGMFVGYTPSVMRALVMCIAVCAGGMLTYRNDTFTSLFMALGVLILQNPYSLFSVGMWLSFLCTLGIITVSPYLPEQKGKRKKRIIGLGYAVVNSVIITLVASLFSFPVIWLVFGEFSLLSPVINLIAVPLSSWATVTGYIGIIIKPLVYITKFLLYVINILALWADGIGFSTVSTYLAGMWIAMLISLISIIIVCWVKTENRIRVFGICTLCFWLCVLSTQAVDSFVSNRYILVSGEYNDYCNQTAIVSDGECAFIENGGGRYVLGETVFKLGETEIDVYIMHRCNYFGLSNLQKMLSNVKVKKLYLGDENLKPKYYNRIVALANKWDIPVYVYYGTVTVPVGDCLVTAGETSKIQYNGKEYDYSGLTTTVYLRGKE